MEKTIFKEKYDVLSRTIKKEELSLSSMDEIISYFKQKIENHPAAQLISVFDNFSHTKNLNGEINPEIKDARNVIFCFGKRIPATKAVALRPRSIAICELEDSYTLDFVEAPNPDATNFMKSWCEELK